MGVVPTSGGWGDIRPAARLDDDALWAPCSADNSLPPSYQTSRGRATTYSEPGDRSTAWTNGRDSLTRGSDDGLPAGGTLGDPDWGQGPRTQCARLRSTRRSTCLRTQPGRGCAPGGLDAVRYALGRLGVVP